ncbi:MAG: hypothetical protein ACTSPV_01095 [Candidatus Hodarchaeales archaeon]
MKRKSLKQEDDLIIWREYEKVGDVSVNFNEIIFWTFMIVLYYSGYARWFFWFILIFYIFYILIRIFDGLPSYERVLKKELKRRGYLNEN